MKMKLAIILFIFSGVMFSAEFSEDDLRLSIPILLHSGNKAEAEKRVFILLKKYPSRSTYIFAAEILVQLGKRDIAGQYWYRGINRLENDYFELEQIFYKYSLYPELKELYEKILLKSPRNYYIRLKLLRIYRALNKVDDFFVTIKHLIHHREDIPAALITEIHAIGEEHGIKVEPQLKQLSENRNYPNRIRLLFYETLAKIYLSVSRFNSFFYVYKTLIKENFYTENQIITEVLRKVILTADEERVKDFLLYLLIRYPNHYDLVFFYTEYLFKAGDWQESLEMAQKSIEKFSGIRKAPFQVIAAKILVKLGRFSEAESFIRQFPPLYENEKKMLSGIVEMSRENYTMAQKILSDTDSPEKFYYLIHVFLFLGNMPEAEKTLKQWFSDNISGVSEQGFTFYLVFNNLSKDKKLLASYTVLMKDYFASRLEKVGSALNKLRSTPIYPFITHLLAQRYFKRRNWAKTEEFLKNILQEKNFFGEKALFLLGNLYIKKMNKKNEGEKLLYKLLEKFPDTVFKSKISLLLGRE